MHYRKKLNWNEFCLLPSYFHILGIVLFGFVFLNKRSKSIKDEELNVLLNHERIHIKQQLELLFLPFFILYIGEWLVLLIKYKSRNLAYRNISFEKEAYDHAENLNYLKSRKPYFWINYWKKPKNS
jgi:hypothetical protein